MSEKFSQLCTLLTEVVLPNLRAIQASQAEQRAQTERLHRKVEEFQTEMLVRFAEIRVELAACRAEIEDAMVLLRDSDTVDNVETNHPAKKNLIH